MTESQMHNGGRRKNQDYTNCLAFLPEQVWSRILKAPVDRLRADEVAHFLFTVLQLRLPSEGTYAAITGVLASLEPSCTSFDLRTKLQIVKTAWTSMKTRLGKTHADPPQLLQTLPATFEELPEELRAQFGEARPLHPWPINAGEVERQILRVPIRSTHASLQEKKANPLEALADILMLRAQGGRSSGENIFEAGLKNLKIFSPTRRSSAEGKDKEKQLQLQRLAVGDALRHGASGGVPQAPLCLEDQRSANGTEVPPCAPARSGAKIKAVGDAFSTGDAGCGSISTGACHLQMLVPVGDNAISARGAASEHITTVACPREASVPEGDKQQPAVPAGDAGRLEKQQGAPKTRSGAYEAHAAKFLASRQAAKEAKANRGSGEELAPQGEPCSRGKGLKRPAAAMKRPAGKRPREQAVTVEPEVGGYHNVVFQAKTHGKCKVEYYTHKSYIRRFQEDAKKWVMVLGCTHPKHHKKVCALLVPHVKRGCLREALLQVRAEILTQLGD